MHKLSAFGGTTIFSTDKPCKCMICELPSDYHAHLTYVHGNSEQFAVHVQSIKNMIVHDMRAVHNRGTMLKWKKHSFPYVCQLCWYGIISNYVDYIWDGKNLLVFDANRGEYIAATGNEYFPTAASRIKFKLDETTKKWTAMPR